MTSLTLQQLVDALADHRLLSPEQHREFTHDILTQCQEPRILSAELVYREWLTPFQLEVISSHKTRKLFLGAYTLLDCLGQGSMGKVFLARNWKTQKKVALKLIRDEHCQNVMAIRRFKREICALRKVSHPNIVSVYDADCQGEVIFFVMEYVPGVDLGQLVRKTGPLSVLRTCEYARQAALALENLSQCGLIHRDVKPSNLLLENRDRRIKLLDLGLARFLPDSQQFSGNLTRLGILIGTPDYISPEQIQDPRNAGIRSDLYSLGCTMYHLLAGKPPFDDVPVVDKLYHQCFSQPKPIEELRGDLPMPLVKIMRRLLEKKSRRRHRKPQHVADALAEVVKMLKPYESHLDFELPPAKTKIRQFDKFEENLLQATEYFEGLSMVKKDGSEGNSSRGGLQSFFAINK